MNIDALSAPQKVSAVSILVVAVAAFLPWISLLGFSVRGIEGDGVITVVLALAGGIVLAMTSGLVGRAPSTGKVPHVVLLVLASLTALVGIIDMNGAAVIGLYLTLLGGVAWVVGAVWQLSLGTSTGTSPSETATVDPGA